MSSKVINLPGRAGKASNIHAIWTQLALAFDVEHGAFVFPLDEVDGQVFLDRLRSLKPTFVLDLRHFQHFNLTGVSGVQSRVALHESGTMYVAHGISLSGFELNCGEFLELNDSWKSVSARIFLDGECIVGPIFVLVHKARHARIVSNYLRDKLPKNADWTVAAVE